MRPGQVIKLLFLIACVHVVTVGEKHAACRYWTKSVAVCFLLIMTDNLCDVRMDGMKDGGLDCEEFAQIGISHNPSEGLRYPRNMTLLSLMADKVDEESNTEQPSSHN